MKKSQAITVLASLVCFLSLEGISNASTNEYSVEGMVFCDTCRLQFLTRVSYMMEGAKVKLQCRNITTGTENYNAEAVSNIQGKYVFKVSGDYEDDICQVTLLKSPKEECSDVPAEAYSRQAAQISLAANNGEASPVRNANPLGFMRKEPLPECHQVIKELEMYDDDEGLVVEPGIESN